MLKFEIKGLKGPHHLLERFTSGQKVGVSLFSFQIGTKSNLEESEGPMT